MKWLWLSALAVVLDQVSKNMAEAMLTLYRPIEVIAGFFNWTLMYNKGAAFSFLSNAGGWQRWLFVGLSTVISIGLFFWLKKLTQDESEQIREGKIKTPNNVLYAAISLVLGGAIGNLIDRALYGQVIDFIQVYYSSYYFPAFNIADAAITLGAGLLILDMILESKREQKNSSKKQP